MRDDEVPPVVSRLLDALSGLTEQMIRDDDEEQRRRRGLPVKQAYTQWYSCRDQAPAGVGGQVWVAYRNVHHPEGWNLRVQWSIKSEMAIDPEFWTPVIRPSMPRISEEV